MSRRYRCDSPGTTRNLSEKSPRSCGRGVLVSDGRVEAEVSASAVGLDGRDLSGEGAEAVDDGSLLLGGGGRLELEANDVGVGRHAVLLGAERLGRRGEQQRRGGAGRPAAAPLCLLYDAAKFPVGLSS